MMSDEEKDPILEAIDKLKDMMMARILEGDKKPEEQEAQPPEVEEPAEEPEIEAEAEALEIEAEPKKPTVMKSYSFSKAPGEALPPKPKKQPVKKRF
jgi:hypothetical protein